MSHERRLDEMVQSKKKKRRRDQSAQISSTPFTQYRTHMINANLVNKIVSDGVSAGISHDEAHGIIDAVLLDYDNRCYREQKSCLRTLVQSKYVALANERYGERSNNINTSTTEGCGRVTFDLNVSVLDYDSTGGISAIIDIDLMSNLLCDYMPDMITSKEAKSIVTTVVNQSFC